MIISVNPVENHLLKINISSGAGLRFDVETTRIPGKFELHCYFFNNRHNLIRGSSAPYYLFWSGDEKKLIDDLNLIIFTFIKTCPKTKAGTEYLLFEDCRQYIRADPTDLQVKNMHNDVSEWFAAKRTYDLSNPEVSTAAQREYISYQEHDGRYKPRAFKMASFITSSVPVSSITNLGELFTIGTYKNPELVAEQLAEEIRKSCHGAEAVPKIIYSCENGCIELMVLNLRDLTTIPEYGQLKNVEYHAYLIHPDQVEDVHFFNPNDLVNTRRALLEITGATHGRHINTGEFDLRKEKNQEPFKEWHLETVYNPTSDTQDMSKELSVLAKLLTLSLPISKVRFEQDGLVVTSTTVRKWFLNSLTDMINSIFLETSGFPNVSTHKSEVVGEYKIVLNSKIYFDEIIQFCEKQPGDYSDYLFPSERLSKFWEMNFKNIIEARRELLIKQGLHFETPVKTETISAVVDELKRNSDVQSKDMRKLSSSIDALTLVLTKSMDAATVKNEIQNKLLGEVLGNLREINLKQPTTDDDKYNTSNWKTKNPEPSNQQATMSGTPFDVELAKLMMMLGNIRSYYPDVYAQLKQMIIERTPTVHAGSVFADYTWSPIPPRF